MNDNASFGYWLRRRRKAHDLTQAELARRVGCSAGWIRMIEADTRRPSRLIAESLADQLAIPAAERAAFLKVARRELAVHGPTESARSSNSSLPPSPDTLALQTLESPSNNLPVQLTSFIGREKEIADFQRLLSPQSEAPARVRLLTLTGAGGCGKTRLALQVASKLLPELQGDVWLTEFGPLADAMLVPQAVASALGAREQTGRSLTETLSNQLESRKVLLVFDNCEHLLAACSQLAAALLRACPNLRILATSRETLNLAGETIRIVPPLSLPNPQPWRGPTSSQEAFPAYQQSEAVRLFAERATAASPTFTLTLDNGPWVAEICRRLDGLPLAIELAAARVRALSVQQIAERLEHRFHLLVAGSRLAPPRQQSLEATLEWSYALLSPSEQKVLQRLSVFAGGWTLEAAEAVCPGGGVAPGEVVNLLSQLVDKSLVQTDPAAGATRYRLLETIRQYAARRLGEAGEEAAWRDRHLDFFVDWAETAERRRAGPDQLAWLSRFQVEHDNLRAALAWGLESQSGAERGLRLASVMGELWRLLGFHSEGRLRLSGALAHAGDAGVGTSDNAAARLRALRWAGILAFLQSDYPTARASCQASLNFCQQLGQSSQYWLAFALELLGEVETEEGNYAAALPLYQEALMIFQQLHETNGLMHTLTMLGWLQMRAGDYERAAETLDEAVSHCRAVRDPGLIAQALAGRGELAVRQGQYPRATTLLEESLDLRRSICVPWEIAVSLGSLGWVALRQHDFKRMRERLGESLDIRMKTGEAGGSAWCLEKLAQAAVLQGQAAPASRRMAYFQRAARVFGAAAAWRARLHAVMDNVDQPEFERHLAQLRAALGEEVFAGAWAEGGAMSLELAADDALAEPESPADDELLPANEIAKETFGGLTARERQVAALIAQGQSNRKIAQALVVSVKTVETYVTRVLNRLGFDSRVQIATWAVEKGLAPPAKD